MECASLLLAGALAATDRRLENFKKAPASRSSFPEKGSAEHPVKDHFAVKSEHLFGVSGSEALIFTAVCWT